ncbi:MAG: O-succinylhomoserine sulfhydrylase [Rhodospirillaceae bacterium]|jgi:O-succinylhomoserine sulfhydrylase|nr:O-succinylhomoserine sulfhydrylase [Rhodospirillaceae bacterium]MBT3883855.1 O-succinylhomoserine sulfhydrylase [Rhodospirillaceae bacterium]MBT4117827.1 O-succinylhomoserine sulfhydrylase [Rhodospirillaceae bacterium]MBT4672955.1 O-succinylhomoserine sulfhydrylase [Rhodospirillaceae bacterium]MBT5840282.1 O-succinylhomoserine sulfhydrylase [Rhodospirillaceae bacterium]
MSNDNNPDSWRRQTNLVRGGLERSQFDEISEAMYLTSSYSYETAEQAQRAFKGEEDHYLYSRYGNPSVTMFEERMKLMEGAKICQSTASGMGAVFASLACMLKSGDRLVASKALFGSCDYVCTVLMPQYGVETETVASTDLSHWERALSKPTNAVFLETPSNPMMQVLDIEAIAELAHKAGARLIVDNVFATPLFQKPLELGADVVMYSTTKHIDGQGRTLGGAVLTNDEEYYQDHMRMFIRHTGPTLSPFNAWVLTKSLETLELRVRAQAAAATAIAEYLDGEAGILKVVFPGLDSHPQADLIGKQMTGPGTVVVFELNGDQARTFRFMNALRLIDISNNLGDAKSMITHPTTTTHQRVSPEERAQLGIHENMVRLSVGLEDVEDLKEDIAQAIKA